MHINHRRSSTDPRLRSLLQKAVRRGAVEVVERVVNRLALIGDLSWVRARAVVIVFEECWPLSQKINENHNLDNIVDFLRLIALSKKQKDAAGLGAMAYAYRYGDTATLSFGVDARSIKIISEALDRPKDFFRWALEKISSEDAIKIVHAAQTHLSAATWGWDKACILAGCYLAVVGKIPDISPTEIKLLDKNFPYWVALDKHTDEGKIALRKLADNLKISYKQLLWVSFYFESARVNEMLESPWFTAEYIWRFNSVGLTYEAAQELWYRVGSHLEKNLVPESEELVRLIDEKLIKNDNQVQSRLL